MEEHETPMVEDPDYGSPHSYVEKENPYVTKKISYGLGWTTTYNIRPEINPFQSMLKYINETNTKV